VPALDSLPFPDAPAPAAFPAGEAEAQRRLDAFLSGPIVAYATQRDRMDLAGTSLLSPYLRFGMLSARQAALAAGAVPAEAQVGAAAWLNELIWREFYLGMLENFPQVLHASFKPALRAIPWRHAPSELQAWQQGQTGYPVVDAAMRQLLATGWMHNRARMIVASFLVKNLLINWQSGEEWFMRLLVDGDPAANNGGWQWVAGVGADAAPYFRIFNPLRQAQKFDPQGDYVRRWVPELADLPPDQIHTPWLAAQRRGSPAYPAPIVDISQTKERTLAAYRAAKS
jgi:deoxyribodipyrimidine photo-lyase